MTYDQFRLAFGLGQLVSTIPIANPVSCRRLIDIGRTAEDVASHLMAHSCWGQDPIALYEGRYDAIVATTEATVEFRIRHGRGEYPSLQPVHVTYVVDWVDECDDDELGVPYDRFLVEVVE